MGEDNQEIYDRLAQLEQEVKNLREGYRITSQRYTDALTQIHKHAMQAEKAAKRSAERVEKAVSMVEKATDLASRTIEMAATYANEQAEERGRALLEVVKLNADETEAVKLHIAAAAQDAKKAHAKAALAVKAVAAASAITLADEAATEVAFIKSNRGN